jgi:hypothetical protein
MVVAALAGKGLAGFGVGVAQLLGVDVVAAAAGEVGAVGRGGEPTVGDPDPARRNFDVLGLAFIQAT